MTTVKLTTNVDWLRPELADVVRLFLGDVPISETEGELVLEHFHAEEGDSWIETAVSGEARQQVCVKANHEGLEEKRTFKRAAKTALFMLLRDKFGFCPPWGSLTGIRPTRLIYEAMERGLSLAEAEKWVQDSFFVSPEKARLLSEIVNMQQGVIYPPADSFDMLHRHTLLRDPLRVLFLFFGRNRGWAADRALCAGAVP